MMFGTRELFEYFCCAACDTLQIHSALDGEELMRHYPSNYYSHNASAQPGAFRWLVTQHDAYKLRGGNRMLGAFMRARVSEGIFRVLLGGDVVRMLAQLAVDRDARILDVGCGTGGLVDRLTRIGFNNLCGADPFIEADGESSEGVPLMKTDLSAVAGKYDLIMFNHSLEHVPDPVATLKVAYEKLAVGGMCLARVPTTSSEAWTTYRADWVQADAPRHMVIPSRQGMAMAAERAGMRVVRTFDDSNLGQFLGSEAYRRDVSVTDPKILRMFGPKRLWEWEKRALLLNRQGLGDQTGFVLRAM
ncbi:MULTISPECIES: class I SAM-dependent methyltransferase [unclassified Mycolicibacterium]|uniref:class I SAM-dependent methyltransferase n=1 Tax=unclassified Mycolicibacterium TaxID=2636767 RepID=UPI0012DE56D4|nr:MULTISPECIES: class I SAM-dependent methyltransferase [unclassified Mycolicibacterium]MUL84659.1 class I SAM-dependent methyltransferase [Mycolicibacterium sp. CBMA 329]MUL88434.1 class I SAM-dependent methyltransferase [Mycolicibacterium sp. CBMA 331]MUM03175.1 class I SAM-dependent methyltransferase [Mycolicibacterium sp. CBMA 334]MUM29996.1 class I SAM-dependent methyltransferase [Mycolicibacterium sp. CBMA 295]MUM40081.1 class I SAM-dependent methyltransferase [Mycolicibacterium sp. CBM